MAAFSTLPDSSQAQRVTSKRLFKGPLLVALGASLWATDSIFRAPVVHRYSPLMIVTLNHVLLVFPALLLLWRHKQEILKLTLKQWLALAYIGCLVSVLGTIAFTEAFASTSNYSIPVLIQKIQPCFAIILGHLFLGEKVRAGFWPLAFLALLGTYLLSFGVHTAWSGNQFTDVRSISLAFIAALIWGSGTVVGRQLLGNLSFSLLTAARFFFGTIFAVFLSLLVGEFTPNSGEFSWPPLADLGNFLAMAFVSGLLPIWIYYRGLRSTPVPVAALCELAFPIVSILLNWVYLGASLGVAQLAGAGLIVLAIFTMSSVLRER